MKNLRISALIMSVWLIMLARESGTVSITGVTMNGHVLRANLDGAVALDPAGASSDCTKYLTNTASLGSGTCQIGGSNDNIKIRFTSDGPSSATTFTLKANGFLPTLTGDLSMTMTHGVPTVDIDHSAVPDLMLFGQANYLNSTPHDVDSKTPTYSWTLDSSHLGVTVNSGGNQSWAAGGLGLGNDYQFTVTMSLTGPSFSTTKTITFSVVCGADRYADGVDSCAACASKTYSPQQRNHCYLCPTHYTCAGTGAGEIACAPSQFTIQQGAASCTSCPAGYSCTPTTMTKCGNNRYSVAGDSTCTLHSSTGKAYKSKAEAPLNCIGQTYASASVTAWCKQVELGKYFNNINSVPNTCGASQSLNSNTPPTGCENCPAGWECPSKVYLERKSCPTGTYSLSGEIECTACPGGKKCTSTSSTPQTCSSAHPGSIYFSLEGMIDCIECPVGNECAASRDQAPTPCASGWVAAIGSAACTECPAGRECSDISDVTGSVCGTGEYSPAGDMFCHKCPVGKNCTTSAVIGECIDGEYSELNNRTCTTCNVGFSCPSPSRSENVGCSAGYYQDAQGRTSCKICPKGMSCSNTGEVGCNPGEYSDNGMSNCVTCPIGHYCLGGSGVGPTPASPGRTCSTGANSDANCPLCDPGFYCPSAIVADKLPCSSTPVEYSYSTGGSAYCTICPPGESCTASTHTSCPGTEMSGPGEELCIACTGGTSCPSAVWDYKLNCPLYTYSIGTDLQCHPVPPGKQFLSTTQLPTNCLVGEYSTGLNDLCQECSPGYICPNTDKGPIPCPFGEYTTATKQIVCLKGGPNRDVWDMGVTGVACQTGYYSPPTVGGAGENWCRVCPTGYTCDGGTGVASQCGINQYSPEGDADCHTCDGATGGVCPVKSGYPQVCPPGMKVDSDGVCGACGVSGQYSLGGVEACTNCPDGYYCKEKHMYPVMCPKGHYSPLNSENCAKCTDGYLCEPGSIVPNHKICPKGYYCVHSNHLTGVFYLEQAFPCPAGTYSDTQGLGIVCSNQCVQGYYCPPGTIDPLLDRTLKCPKGHYCPTGTTHATQNPCPAGSYNPDEASFTPPPGSSGGSCPPCGPGTYCPEGSSKPTNCPPGYVCPAGSGDLDSLSAGSGVCSAGTFNPVVGGASCENCPKGFYCEEGAPTPVYCPAGTYRDTTGATAIVDCINCTAGMACPNIGATTEETSVTCPPGYACPLQTKFPYEVPCPAGSYSDTTGESDNTNPAVCLPCPLGYACAEGTNKFTNPMVLCDPGYFCGLSSQAPTPAGGECAEGSYNPTYGGSSQADCRLCPPGFTCGEAAAVVGSPCAVDKFCVQGTGDTTGGEFCPAGTSHPGSLGLKSALECITCPAGSYCIGGEIVDPDLPVAPCLPGTYNPIPKQSDPAACLACPPGYSCPAASESPTPCGLGSYSDSSQELCLPCPLGHHCGTTTTTLTQMNAQTCDAGYICLEGTGVYPAERLECRKGSFCLAGDMFPTDCEKGTYNPLTKGVDANACVASPVGFYVDVKQAAALSGECQPGYYCEVNSIHDKMAACPEKTFRDLPRGTAPEDCGPCPAGSFCPSGTTIPIDCPKGHYCTTGVVDPVKCPMGTFGPSKRLRSAYECTNCWMGRFCADIGLVNPSGLCDPGYHCDVASETPNPEYDSISHPKHSEGWRCEVGGFCAKGSTYNLPCPPSKFASTPGAVDDTVCGLCTQQKYCIGSPSSSITGDCRAGYYCPTGSSSPTENMCGAGKKCVANSFEEQGCAAGTYTSTGGESACAICPQGFFCSGANNTGTLSPCTPGNYCPANSGSETPCPAGSYMPNYQAKEIGDCIDCEPGHYCSGTGNANPTAACSPGYFCYKSAISSTPSDVAGKYGKCPIGHYCESGTADPMACPMGSYRSTEQAVNENGCTQCTQGYFCPDVGMTSGNNAAYICSPGYYCPTGTAQPTKALICTPGHKCPEGSHQEVDCSLGEYQDGYGEPVCKSCPKGYYCGAIASTFIGNDCPKGCYCPEGTQTSTQFKCPAGTYNPKENAGNSDFCLDCPPGYYCPTQEMDTVTLECDAGYYCDGGSSTSTQGGNKCTAGYFCPQGSFAKTLCPPGEYCQGDARPSSNGNCAQGYYCTGGSTTDQPTGTNGDICPKGAYCPAGSPLPILCPSGTYNLNTGKHLRTHCLKCSDGKYCTGPGAESETGNCDVGYFCLEADATDTTLGHSVRNPPTHRCPKGYKCPGLPTSADKIDCAAAGLDQHQIYPGQADCEECPAGFECTKDTRIHCDNSQRYESIYCPANQNAKISCGPGKYNMVDGSSVIGDCKDCPPGSYCLNTLSDVKLKECPAGKYCSGTDATAAGTGTCQPGYYCPTGSSYPIPCPAGKYCDGVGMANVVGKECLLGYWCKGLANTNNPNPADKVVGEICPRGYYCPTGTLEPLACPHGNYNPDEGKSELSHCLNCTAGNECPRSAMENPLGSDACPSGYYCPQNATQGEHLPCPKGYKCPAGEDAPIVCDDGTFNPLYMKDACEPCPERMYCLSSNLGTEALQAAQAQFPRECPMGYFCAASTGDYDVLGKKCPAGSFGGRTGLKISTECDPCPPGYYCPTTGMVPSDVNSTKLCDAGYICLGGAQLASHPADTATGRKCFAGYYCHSGDVVDRPCPPGTFANNGDTTKATEAAACQPCPPGRFCPHRGKEASFYGDFTAANAQCDHGFVCLTNSVSAFPYYDKTDANPMGYYCPAGYKCPAGTTGNNEIPCNNGKWQPYVAQGDCIDSPSGRISIASGVPHKLKTDLLDCPTAHYCDPGTNSAANAHECPAGTYSNRINLESSSECYSCDPGKYCLQGTITPTLDCDAGYACPRGATLATPAATYSFATPDTPGRCPVGHYCEVGSKKPMPCPMGSYITSEGSSDPVCIACGPTFYCDELGLGTAPIKNCDDGYVCLGRAMYAKPTDGTTGRLCQKGHYCIAGVETQCAPGTYEPRLGSALCQNCPKGYSCGLGAVTPTICTANNYCAAVSGAPTPCPPGTYTDATGLQSAGECRACVTGWYCTGGARVARCDSGYFCKTGADSATPAGMECPIGHYCDKAHASVLPVICPTGKVRTAPGGTDVNSCSDCPLGEYCIEGLTFGYDCPKGHYCPVQSEIPIPCPTGKYRNSIRAGHPSDCLLCDPGHYCNSTGIPHQDYFACLPGLYCPAGFQSDGVTLVEPVNCTKGTFRNTRGAKNVGDCFECSGGFYCLEGTITPHACNEGTYCPKGSFEPLNCTAGNYCPYGTEIPIMCPEAYYCPASTAYPIKCVSGYYCPNGTVAPIICPPGTMGSNNPANIDELSGCSYCRAGYYSAINDLILDQFGDPVEQVVEEFGKEDPKCKVCPGGFVCLGRTTQGNPTDIDIHRGYECPRGYYCPEGSYKPTACPKGTFNNFLKKSSLEDCNKCDSNTYSYLVAQRGCLPCSANARSDLGSEQCTCIGENRAFQFSTGACLCKPNYEASSATSSADADTNCIPIVYDICPTDKIRGAEGGCISRTECPICPNKGGKRDPGIGICRCDSVQDVEEICDSECRNSALQVALNIKLNYDVTDPVSGVTTTIDLVDSQNVIGDAKYEQGMGHGVTSLGLGANGGFTANYQPLPAIASEFRRALREEFGVGRERYLATTNDGGINSPVICLPLGDTLMFAVNSLHYPVYLKDHLANSQADFDYGAFTNLEERVKAGDQVDTFLFTFTQTGVFVIGDVADSEQIAVVGVMDTNEKCNDPDKYIQPVTYDSLLKLGVTKSENIQESPNWTFILIIFLIMIVGIPVLIWLITFLHNQHRQKISLNAIKFAQMSKKKKRPGTITEAKNDKLESQPINYTDTDDASVSDVSPHRFIKPRDKKEKTKTKVKMDDGVDEIDHQLFDDIYQELHHHAEYMKKQFKNKSKQDHKNLMHLYQEVMKLEQIMESNLKNITKSMGVKEVRNIFKKEAPVRDKGKAFAYKLIEYDKKVESDEESELAKTADKIVDEVIIEDELVFNRVLETSDSKKQVFLKAFSDEQKNIYDDFRKRVQDLPNLDKSEREEILKEFDKQMLTMNKMLVLEEEKQDSDLNEKLAERRMRRSKLKEKLQDLEAKESNAKKVFAHEAAGITSERVKQEKEIDEEFEKGKNEGMKRINEKKRQRLEKYEGEFRDKMTGMSNQRKIGKLLEKYQSDAKKLGQTLDNENKLQVADLLQRLESRRQEKQNSLKYEIEGKLNELDSTKSGQVYTLLEQQDKLTKHLKDGDLEKAIQEIFIDDEENMKDQELQISNLFIAQKSRENELEMLKNQELVRFRQEMEEEENNINEKIIKEKVGLEQKLRSRFHEAEKERQGLKNQLRETEEDDERDYLLKSIRDYENITTARLNAERDKLVSSIQERQAGRRKKIRGNEKEIIDKFEGEIKAGQLETTQLEKKLKTKLRQERLHRLIKITIEQMNPDEVPFALDKIIEELHIDELSDLLQDQFKEKAKELKYEIKSILGDKLIELGEIKDIYEVQYKKLKGLLDERAIHQIEYDRRMVEIKGKENDKIRDMNLKYTEKQNSKEEEMIENMEQMHGEQLIKLKEDQYTQKKDLLRKYVGDDLLEKALAGEEDWMEKQISKYRFQLRAKNSEKLSEIEERKMKISEISTRNHDKILHLESQTKKLMDEQEEREIRRKEKQDWEIEEMKSQHERELLSQGITDEQKKLMLEQHAHDLKVLSDAMDLERERQGAMLRRKLEGKLRESESLKRVKDQQLAVYNRDKKAQLDLKVNEIQMGMLFDDTFTKPKKDPFDIVVCKFEEKKVLFDKHREIQGMEELQKMQEMPIMNIIGIGKEEIEEKISGLRKFDFDEALRKMGKVEQKLNVFKETQFAKVIIGCRSISQRLAYLKQLEELLTE